MEVGDRFDVRRSPAEAAWMILQQPIAGKAGDRVIFDLEHQGAHREVTLVATPEPMSLRSSSSSHCRPSRHSSSS
jgi:hypothetical protein